MTRKKTEKDIAYNKNYYLINRDKILEKNKLDRQRPEVKEKRHQYYLLNRDHIIEKSKKNKQKNRQLNPDKYKEINKEYRERPEVKEKQRVYSKIDGRKRKKQVIDNYGGICACCGENRMEFLSIDHINNDGANHRKQTGGHMYAWLIKNNFPSGYRVLCYNCNMSLGFYGYCPHISDGKNDFENE